MLLEKRNRTSFYYNGELVDVEMLQYKVRKAGGGRNHQRNTALACLRGIATGLCEGYNFENEKSDLERIPEWLRELSI